MTLHVIPPATPGWRFVIIGHSRELDNGKSFRESNDLSGTGDARKCRVTVALWSNGVKLDADVFRPRGLDQDARVPAVVLSHGIGGDKQTAERYAAKFAAEEQIAISFSHASWAGSQGRIIPIGELPIPDENGEAEVRARLVREVLDPLDWVESYIAALDYIEGEPNVDVNRMGAWGTSFGGGTAFYVAANDKRVKALAIQVPAVFNPPLSMVQHGRQRAIQIARGEFDPIPQGIDELPGLTGTPHYAKFARYDVGDQVEKLDVPALILDAANEEMFDIEESGAAVARRLKERGIETYYEVIPDIDHYGIYFGGFDRGSQLAVDWFRKHL